MNLSRYCGTQSLEPIIADGNRVRIVFHSDGNVHRGGFKAEYSISGGEPEAGMGLSCLPITKQRQDHCACIKRNIFLRSTPTFLHHQVQSNLLRMETCT